MKVFLDTNVLLDAFDERNDPRLIADGRKIISLAIGRCYDLYMSVLSVPTMAYLIKRKTSEEKKALIQEIVGIVTPLPSLPEHIQKAMNSPMNDIEDALQLLSALEGGCDVIITRDTDFKKSGFPVITPSDFLRRISAAD